MIGLSLEEFQYEMATKRANGKANIKACQPQFQQDVIGAYTAGPSLMAFSLYDRVLGVEGHLSLFTDELQSNSIALVEFWDVYRTASLSAISGSKQRLLQEAAKAYMASGQSTSVLSSFFADAKKAYKSTKGEHTAHFDRLRSLIDNVLASNDFDRPTKEMSKALLTVLFEDGKPAKDLKPSKKLNARLAKTYDMLVGKKS